MEIYKVTSTANKGRGRDLGFFASSGKALDYLRGCKRRILDSPDCKIQDEGRDFFSYVWDWPLVKGTGLVFTYRVESVAVTE